MRLFVATKAFIVHPAPREAAGGSPWRNARCIPKGHNHEATAGRPWSWVHKDKVLILRESGSYSDGTNAGRWDVPGGRIEPGQNFKESLLREIQEETGLSVRVGRPFYVGEWRPVVRGEEWQIVGIYFVCEVDSNTVQLSADHDAFQWINPPDFKNRSIIPNVNAAFEAYLNLTKSG